MMWRAIRSLVGQRGGIVWLAWQFALCLAAGPAGAAEPAPVVTLESPQLLIAVDAQDGRLRRFVHRPSQTNLVDEGATVGPLWEMSLEVKGRAATLSPVGAARFRVEPVGVDSPELPQGSVRKRRWRLSWSDFSEPDLSQAEVAVTVAVDGDDWLSRWTIAVTKPAEARLRMVCFPRVFGLLRQPGERLAVPRWMGLELAEPRRLLCPPSGRPRRWTWNYPGPLSLQCLAYYGARGGLYLACDDTAAFLKAFSVGGESQGSVWLEAIHYPEGEAAGLTSWCLPYWVHLGAFVGDWVTAAERYRRWAEQQPWAVESRLRRGAVPQWVRETSLWIWNRGHSGDVLKPAAFLRQRLQLPVNVLWHWWHGCPYDVGFPEYFPPREGTESFRRAIGWARRQGVRALVYMNQRAWGTSTESWKRQNAVRYAVKTASGQVHSHVYNIFTGKALASMCLGTEFWRDKYAGLAERAFCELGVAGIYMDQACLSLACYDRAHGHPIGGGNYWIDGFRRLVADIRRRCDGRRTIVLAGEGCGEPWLAELDLMLALQVSRERYASPGDHWEVIPFFQAVYHPLAITFGSYSSLTMPPYDELWPREFAPREPLALLDQRYSNQFYLEQARAFVWGQQLTLANFRPELLDQRPQEMRFLIRLAKVRREAAKYLCRGQFLRPPQCDVPEAESDFSRLSIYAGRRDRLTSTRKRHPLVLVGAWRADDGDVGLALVNIADRPVLLDLPLDRTYYGLHGRIAPRRIDHTGRRDLPASALSGGRLHVELPPRQAWVVELDNN